jgi:hypothetical protein
MEQSKFNSWYTRVLEAVNTQEPTATTTTEVETKTSGSVGPEVDSITPSFSREEIMNDIDTIMTHLSQLGTQVKEELESIDDSVINEAGTETAMDKVKDFLFAPKYRSMQAKVNKMKMNALDIKLTADNLSGKEGTPEKAKKDMLITKKATLDTQIKDLQSAVDDKAKERGSYVQKVLSTEKIKGQMDLVKRASGQEDDPAKKKSLADSAKELAARYKEEQEAVKDLKDKAEPTPEEKAEAERLKADKAAKAKEDEEAAARAKEDAIAADKKAADDKAAADKAEADKAEADKKAADDKAAADKAEADKKAADDKAAADKAEADKAAKKDADGADDATKADREKKNSKEGKLERLKDMLAKAKESGDEEKVKKVQDLIDKVSAKESWQLEGTELGRLIEAEINLLDNQIKLNESKFSMSVADRMRVLLG